MQNYKWTCGHHIDNLISRGGFGSPVPRQPARLHTQPESESFNDRGGGRGCDEFVPVLGGDSKKTVPTADLFDQPPGEMS